MRKRTGWNALAFLSGFFLSSLSYFLVLGAQGGRLRWESFLSSGNRKKRQKGKQNRREQDSHQTMKAMERNLSSCSEDIMEIRPKVE